MQLDQRRIWLASAMIVGVFLGDIVAIAVRSPSPAGPGATGSKKPAVISSGTRKPPTSTRTAGPGTLPTSRPGGSSGGNGAQMLLPPAVGTYNYKTSHSSSSSGGTIESGSATYAFSKARKEEKFYSQTVRINNRQGRITRTNRWAVDGLYHVKDQYAEDRSCTYDPPRQAIRYPLVVGDRWTQGLPKCQEGNPLPAGATVEGSETTRVLRTEMRSAGGTSVLCYVFEVTTLANFDSPQGSGTTRSVQLQWFAPAYSLYVRVEQNSETTTTSTTGQTNKSSSRSTTILKSLKPS